ncbi:RING finger 148-like protein [Iridovirus CN01]|nr:RING finger 148-like protein [Iridovirus CN01]UPA43569.1 RING finger 148-like protein [Iridovirus CN01]UPA43604.1 RING finger 148-like protein [Iridovirus CN01]UPA43766.1 RING finger 148-like protein [Iridovirus CN01]
MNFLKKMSMKRKPESSCGSQTGSQSQSDFEDFDRYSDTQSEIRPEMKSDPKYKSMINLAGQKMSHTLSQTLSRAFKRNYFNTGECAICLSKIKRIDLNLKKDKRMGVKKKLVCNHVFHKKCIEKIYKKQCPLCVTPILSKVEEFVLECYDKNEDCVIETLKLIDPENIFLHIHKSDPFKYEGLKKLLYKYCDMTNMLAKNLSQTEIAFNIITNGTVNWYKTFYGGKTFLDLVQSPRVNRDIKILIENKFFNSIDRYEEEDFSYRDFQVGNYRRSRYEDDLYDNLDIHGNIMYNSNGGIYPSLDFAPSAPHL